MAKKKKTTRSRSRKKVRVAIIGAGGRALSAHYPALADIPALRSSPSPN